MIYIFIILGVILLVAFLYKLRKNEKRGTKDIYPHF